MGDKGLSQSLSSVLQLFSVHVGVGVGGGVGGGGSWPPGEPCQVGSAAVHTHTQVLIHYAMTHPHTMQPPAQ